MSEPDEPKPGDASQPRTHRDREDVLRDIKLALAMDGLGLQERRRQARGFDPYDSALGGNSRDVWRGRRRG
ncbi:MAG TPA: hypothetical protein VID71_03555 [Steroidobacteraceae bacterium]|jgi:hypothetical protein